MTASLYKWTSQHPQHTVMHVHEEHLCLITCNVYACTLVDVSKPQSPIETNARLSFFPPVPSLSPVRTLLIEALTKRQQFVPIDQQLTNVPEAETLPCRSGTILSVKRNRVTSPHVRVDQTWRRKQTRRRSPTPLVEHRRILSNENANTLHGLLPVWSTFTCYSIAVSRSIRGAVSPQTGSAGNKSSVALPLTV